MRYIALAAVAALACRGHEAPAPGAGAPRAAPSGSAASVPAAVAASRPSGISDEQLVAFVRWQRDYNDALGRQQAEMEAITAEASKKFDDASAKEAERAVAELAVRFRPVITDLHRRQPLSGAKWELATEAVGGLYHWEWSPAGAQLVFVRDEERIGAARRRFGEKPVDDILARESLILAEVQRP